MAKFTRSDAVRAAREGARKGRPPFAVFSLRSAAVVVFFVFLLTGVMFGKIGAIVPFFYLVMSVITFVIYAVDKQAAEGGGWRTRERTLHLLEAACGWPGALLAQGWLRHKSRKLSFGAVFYVAVIANLAALLWLVSRHAL